MPAGDVARWKKHKIRLIPSDTLFAFGRLARCEAVRRLPLLTTCRAAVTSEEKSQQGYCGSS
jgi:hypothetical protein